MYMHEHFGGKFEFWRETFGRKLLEGKALLIQFWREI
jgi:hypothetical protein